jgi:hypothetical protein
MKWLLLCSVSVLLAACGSSLCGTEVLEERPSPSGAYTASVLKRNCGATTPFVNIVSLRESSAQLDTEDDESWVFTIHGESKVAIEWRGDRSLLVKYSGTGDNPTKRTKWRSVSVDFE